MFVIRDRRVLAAGDRLNNVILGGQVVTVIAVLMVRALVKRRGRTTQQ